MILKTWCPLFGKYLLVLSVSHSANGSMEYFWKGTGLLCNITECDDGEQKLTLSIFKVPQEPEMKDEMQAQSIIILMMPNPH